MNSSSHTNDHLVPPEEQRCVWMTAGVVSYQLCDRKFDCDNCPLDAAIRKNRPVPGRHQDKSVTSAPRSAAGEDLREGYLYCTRHCWVRRRAETLVRVGIEPGLAAALLSPKSIAFPSVGEYVNKEQVCLWVITTGGTFPITAPLNGRVWAVNSLLNEQPHTIVHQPYDRGWLMDLTVAQGEISDESLMEQEEANKLFAEDDARFQSLLTRALSKGYASVGMTMADGGEPLWLAADKLGPKKYFTMLCEVFG